MKKNFFKKLATVLSLAMVVTSVAPLAGTSASAAATPDIKTRRTTAYEGNSYSYAVKNAKGYTVKWAVSGKLATISKAGKLTVKTKGAKAGTVVVSAAFYKNGKKVVTRKDSVAIKVSAKSVAITTAADTKAVGVGEVADFNRKLTPSNSTSKTYYSVTAKDGAATTDATIDTAGKFTATKAGEYVVTATVRNAKDSKVLATTTANVTVVYKVKEAKQTTATKLDVTFGADVSKVITKDNLVITDANGVKTVVKAVTFSADGKVATAETYLEFRDKTTYNVAYGESKVSFVASKGDPVKVVVTAKTVQYGKPTPFVISLFDANGVDVTTENNCNESYMSFDYDKTAAYINYKTADKKYEITMFDYDKTVSVKATYHTWKYENNAEVKYESDAATFTSVKEIKDTANDLSYTLETGAADWSKLNTSIDSERVYKLYVKGTNQNNDTVREGAMSFESTDTSILTVADTDANGGVTVYGIKAGTAYVKCTYGDTTKMLLVTVGEKRSASALSLDKSVAKLYTTVNGTQATGVTFTVTAKDQYGKEMDYAADLKSITLNAKTGDSKNEISWAQVGTSNKFTVWLNNAAGVTDSTDGSSIFEVEYYDKKITFSAEVVKVDAADLAVSYVALDTNSTTIDAKFDNPSSSNRAVTIKAYQYNNKGQIVGVATNATFKVEFKDKDITGAGNSDTNGYYTSVANSGAVTFVAADIATGKQAAVGTYTVKCTVNSVNIANAVIIVKNTQGTYTVDLKDSKVSAGTVSAIIMNAFKFTNEDGDEVQNPSIVSIKAVVGTNDTTLLAGATIAKDKTIVVKSITVQRTVGGQTFEQVIEVGNKTVVTE